MAPPAHVRWILAILVAAPVLLFASVLLSGAGAISSATYSQVSALCIAALSICNGAMLLSRNQCPMALCEIK